MIKIPMEVNIMKIYTVCVNKVIGTGILAACILAAGIYSVCNVFYDMGYTNGMDKVFEEQEIASQEAHTDWANFGGGYYIIGAEVVSIDNGITTFELISGAQFANTGEFAQDAIYMLTMSDNGTPEWMNDDIICAIWEAK